MASLPMVVVIEDIEGTADRVVEPVTSEPVWCGPAKGWDYYVDAKQRGRVLDGNHAVVTRNRKPNIDLGPFPTLDAAKAAVVLTVRWRAEAKGMTTPDYDDGFRRWDDARLADERRKYEAELEALRAGGRIPKELKVESLTAMRRRWTAERKAAAAMSPETRAAKAAAAEQERARQRVQHQRERAEWEAGAEERERQQTREDMQSLIGAEGFVALELGGQPVVADTEQGRAVYLLPADRSSPTWPGLIAPGASTRTYATAELESYLASLPADVTRVVVVVVVIDPAQVYSEDGYGPQGANYRIYR